MKTPFSSVTLYREFLIVTSGKDWEVRCFNYGYAYPGLAQSEATARTDAMRKVDEFLATRHAPRTLR